jgi:putative flavoprotein involved in K+ transport
MRRDEIAARVARYADIVSAPVALGTEIQRLAPVDGGFVASTNRGKISARQIVVATGSYHRPRIPPVAQRVSDRVLQIHSHSYRNAAALPKGGVLIVGSGQTGVQLAEELAETGRQVYISVGSAGRVPRRYRGRDIIRWLADLSWHGDKHGVSLPTVDQLTDPRLKFSAVPSLSGHGGGHDTNLRQYAANGMRLAGRLADASGEEIVFAADLEESLERSDKFFEERFRLKIDTYIERAGIPAPPDDRVEITYQPDAIKDLNLREAGISTIIWATGYGLDFAWIDTPIFDTLGYPKHARGVAAVPGLFFLGLLWQHSQASATLIGCGLDAPRLVELMASAAV